MRLVAAHALFTLSSLLVLLGLPGLYGAASVRMGRLGLVGFLAAFTGTMLIAVSGNFGFLAPVLASQSPHTIDAINRYLPEVALNGVAFGGFVVGFVVFGLAMAKTASFPAPRVCSSPLVPRSSWLDSLWPSSPHRRCGPLPSLGAWPLAPAWPGLATACGSVRCPNRDHRRRRSRSPSRNHAPARDEPINLSAFTSKPNTWLDQSDPVLAVSTEFSRVLESVIRGDERDGRASPTRHQPSVPDPPGRPGPVVVGASGGHLLLPAQEVRPSPGVGGDHRHDRAGAEHPGPAGRLEPVHLRVRVDDGDPGAGVPAGHGHDPGNDRGGQHRARRVGHRHRHDLFDAGVLGVLAVPVDHRGAGLGGVEQLHQLGMPVLALALVALQGGRTGGGSWPPCWASPGWSPPS